MTANDFTPDDEAKGMDEATKEDSGAVKEQAKQGVSRIRESSICLYSCMLHPTFQRKENK